MKKLLFFIFVFFISFLMKDNSTVESTDMTDYCYVPPSISQIASPNVLFVIDVSGSMSWCAYNPQSDREGCCTSSTGCGWTYKGTEEGYFNPDKVYQYNSSQQYWEETTGSYETCPKMASSISNSKKYKGDCLNFLYMRRVDLVRWAITGGKLDSCKSNDPKRCDPELYGQPAANLSCDSYGCILKSESGQKVKVPWARIYDSLTFQFRNLTLQPRLGVMFYSGTGVRSNKVYVGDFTSSANFDGVNPYKNLIAAINYEDPLGATPTAPALWDAYNYFAQNSPKYGGFTPQSGAGDRWRNPMYQCVDENNNGICQGSELKLVPCAKNFVILLTDGQWNYGGYPVSKTCKIDTGYEDNSADPVVPAYWLHKKGFTNSKTGIYSYVEAVYGIGLWLGGTGEKSLKQVAMYGAFDRSKTWPDGLTGYPTATCSYVDDCCSGTNCGKGSSCTSLPASSSDWDKDGDGVPDTFYSASDATEIKEAVKKAMFDILRKASSGATVATLSSRTEVSSLVIQPYFYPVYQTEDGREISWIGIVRSFWIDFKGRFHEDSIINKILDLAASALDNIIQFMTVGNETKIAVLQGEQCSLGSTKNIDDINTLFNSGCRLASEDQSSRKIYFNKNGDLADFNTSEATTIRGFWQSIDSNINDDTKAGCVIRYIRGENVAGDSNCQALTYVKRPREFNIQPLCGVNQEKTWKLGDIIHSTPSVTSNQPNNFYHVRYTDDTYRQYIVSSNYKNRISVAFVGANDGALHAFRIGTIVEQSSASQPAKLQNSPTDNATGKLGQEEWAFIPRNAIPYLLWYGRNDYCHVPTVDYRTILFDASINGDASANKTSESWRTILVGVMGFGGKSLTAGSTTYSSSVFALDLTGWLNGSDTKPTLLWEITLPDNTLTLSFPTIVRLGDRNKNGEWYVVLGSGPRDVINYSFVSSPKLHFINLRNGSIVKTLNVSLPANTYSAIGDVWNVDVDNDYQDDVIYFGAYGTSGSNVWGNFYRLSLRNGSSYRSVSSLGDTDIKVAVDLSTFKTVNNQPPVFAAPAFTIDDTGNFWVFFGTGRYLNTSDRNIPYTNYLIGFKDPCWNGSCSTTLRKSDLVDYKAIMTTTTSPYQSFTECVCEEGQCQNKTITYNKSTLNIQQDIAPQYGWYHTLNSKEAIVSQPLVHAEFVNNLVLIPPADICEFSGFTRYIALYYKLNMGGKTTVVFDNPSKKYFGTPPIGQAFEVHGSGKLLTQLSSGLIPGDIFPPNAAGARGRFISWIEK